MLTRRLMGGLPQDGGSSSTITKTEDFEDSIYAFSVTIPNDWTRTNAYGANCLKCPSVAPTGGSKGSVGGGGSSVFRVNLGNSKAGTLSFKYWISSELNYDKMNVSLNGSMIFTDSGVPNVWKTYTRESVPMNSYVDFYYTVDVSATGGDNCFYLDDISVTY